MGKSSRKKIKVLQAKVTGADCASRAALNKLHFIIICFLLAIITAGIYWQSLKFDFITMDDLTYIIVNKHVQEGLTANSIRWAFTNQCMGNWHPLSLISFMLDLQIGGMNPQFFHITQIIIHTLNTLLLFLVLCVLTGSMWRSAFVAAMFGIHPLHVESVAWITERKDLLCALFWFFAIWAYVEYSKEQNVKRYLLVVAFFILGIMSKPMIVTFPITLLLLDYWPLRRFEKFKAINLIKEKIPLFALTIITCAIAIWAQKQEQAMASLELRPLGLRLSNVFVSYIAYLIKTVWPSGLAAFYPYPESIPLWKTAGSILVFISISIAAYLLRQRKPYITFGWLWYVITLIPVIGIVQVGAQSHADRYTYIPLIGFFIIIAWGIPDILTKYILHSRTRKIISMAGGIFLTLIYASLSYIQIGYWENNETLNKRSIAVTKNNWVAHSNLSYEYNRQKRYKEALAEAKKALEIRRNYPEARFNASQASTEIGNQLMEQGRLYEAIAYYRTAIKYRPDYANAHYNLGVALFNKKDINGAMRAFAEAVRLKPDWAEAHNNLGATYMAMGLLDKAIDHFNEAIKLNPQYEQAKMNLNLAIRNKN